MLFYLIIAIGLAAVGYGWYQHRQHVNWGQPMMAAGVGLIIVMVIASMVTRPNDADSQAEYLLSQTLRLYAIPGEKLGRTIAAQHADKRVLVIKPITFSHRPGGADAIMQGLRHGLDDAVTIVAEVDPPLPPGFESLDPERYDSSILAKLPPMRSAFTAEAFDAIVGKHADAQVIISLAGLPQQPKASSTLSGANRPYIAAYIIRNKTARSAAKLGMVDLAVTSKEHSAIKRIDQIPDDLDAAFDKKYEIITRK